MNIIKQNPFRILGLTGNATEKELQKQVSIIKRYAEVGKTKSFDYDFEFIGELSRQPAEIQQASNQIEQANKKILYALFWFVKNNLFDEIAFNNLKERDIDKAIVIWNKTLKEEITSKNYSSYLNLSTLYIALATIDEQIELQKLQAGISLKGKLIHSNNLHDFSKLVTGNGIATDPVEISEKFVDEVIELLKPYLNKRNGISTNELISLFNTFPASIKKYVSTKFTEIPISNIENKIEKTTRKRKDNPRDAEEYGEELYKSTKNDITLLKKLMGASNVQFQMIANKLANEILQCSIDFFNKYREENSEFDPGDDALRIVKYAKSIGTTGHTKDRIKEAMTSIQEWVDDKPNRERQKVIAEDLAYITNKLQRFQNLSNSIENSRDLVISCKPKLTNIKNELGSYDDFYLQLSSAVVQNAQVMIVQTVNNAQENIEMQLVLDRYSAINRITNVVRAAWSATELMKNMDMLPEVKEHYSKNRVSLKSLANQLNISTHKPTNSNTSHSVSSSNSYTRQSTKSNSHIQTEEEGLSGSAWFIYIFMPYIALIAMLYHYANDEKKKGNQCLGIVIVMGIILLVANAN